MSAPRVQVGTHATVNGLEKSFAAGLTTFIAKQKKLGSGGRQALQNVALKVKRERLERGVGETKSVTR